MDLMDEKDAKMREVTIEIMKLRQMRDMEYPFYCYNTPTRKREKTKYSWLYVFTGTRFDIVIFACLPIVIPLVTAYIIFMVNGEPLFTPWVYVIVYLTVVALWACAALRLKYTPEEEEIDPAAQAAIVRQKMAELEEIEKRLQEEELQKKQESPEKSESQED